MNEYRPKRLLSIVCLMSIILCSSCSKKRYSDPLSPEEALHSFQLLDGFRIETFAAEPLIADPVDLVFDEQGVAYVVEMGDYPGKPETGKGKGKIRMLADTNNDGRMDRSVIFADSIADATSVLPWEGGLIVAAAPDILFLKDTNGDFRADTREVLFTGFLRIIPKPKSRAFATGSTTGFMPTTTGRKGRFALTGNQTLPC